MKSTKNHTRFVDLDVDVKFWASEPPDVATARPPRCPICEESAYHASGQTRLHGHGLRGRQLRGPLEADGEVVEIQLLLRRYACQACGAVITVGPQGFAPYRRYTLMVIAVALWRWAVHQLTDPEVRRATCPVSDTGLSRPERWTLRRWARAVRERRLWPGLSLDPGWSHEATRGQLRDIDRVATNALRSAARRKQSLVDRELLEQVLERDQQAGVPT